MALGQEPGSILHRDGPWWCESPGHLAELISWLRERGCTDVFVAEVLMPPDAYTKLGAHDRRNDFPADSPANV
jgi:hypothetical protein